MSSKEDQIPSLEFHPLMSDRWADLVRLFGKHGASGGCWCMWWRLNRTQFMAQRGEENKKALKNIVDAGKAPGILAYSENQPIGWGALAPRDAYPTLERSRLLKRVDDKPVWSVVCFFIAKEFRRKGLTVELLKTAIEHVKKRGGRIIEGCPVEPKKGQTPDSSAYTGTASAFRKIGFVEVLRRSETRPIMRYVIKEK